jgi:hypothetical protein
VDVRADCEWGAELVECRCVWRARRKEGKGYVRRVERWQQGKRFEEKRVLELESRELIVMEAIAGR